MGARLRACPLFFPPPSPLSGNGPPRKPDPPSGWTIGSVRSAKPFWRWTAARAPRPHRPRCAAPVLSDHPASDALARAPGRARGAAASGRWRAGGLGAALRTAFPRGGEWFVDPAAAGLGGAVAGTGGRPGAACGPPGPRLGPGFVGLVAAVRRRPAVVRAVPGGLAVRPGGCDAGGHAGARTFGSHGACTRLAAAGATPVAGCAGSAGPYLGARGRAAGGFGAQPAPRFCRGLHPLCAQPSPTAPGACRAAARPATPGPRHGGRTGAALRLRRRVPFRARVPAPPPDHARALAARTAVALRFFWRASALLVARWRHCQSPSLFTLFV